MSTRMNLRGGQGVRRDDPYQNPLDSVLAQLSEPRGSALPQYMQEQSLVQPGQMGSGSVQAAFDGPQSMGEGMVMPPQEFMDASSMMGGPAEAAAGGMTGMQKAGIGAQVGGSVLDALMRMQTRAPAARGAQMRFGRQGPTVAEQFRRG